MLRGSDPLSRGRDSNPRRVAPTDLQSVAIGHSATPGTKMYYTTPRLKFKFETLDQQFLKEMI